MYKLFIIVHFLLTSIEVSSQTSHVKRTDKNIKLSFIENSPEVIFESNVAVIHFEKKELIADIKKRLKEINLCEKKIIRYNNLIENLNKTEKNQYFIEKAIDQKLLMEELAKMDGMQIKPGDSTGYAPLDFFSQQLGNQTESDYVEPYGFVPLTDTTNMVRLRPFFEWMVYDLLLEGKGKVFNKKQNAYETVIINEVISDRGFMAFSGSNLLFSNKKLFYNVYASSCLVTPDIECMDNEEFEQSGGNR